MINPLLANCVLRVWSFGVMAGSSVPNRCILCKEQNYPLTHPKPVMSSLPLKVPLCEPQLESSELEVGVVRREGFKDGCVQLAYLTTRSGIYN